MSRKRMLFVMSSALLLGACGGGAQAPTESSAQSSMESMSSDSAAVSDTTTAVPAESVTVDLINSDGESIGTAVFTENQDNRITLQIDATDLPPGEHGFHIHEVGLVEPPNFESAGGHYNPTNSEHGENNENGPHAGDLPNLVVAEDGTVQEEFTLDGLSLDPESENSLADDNGSALVIHENPDDYMTDPSGNSGNRIAAGVIFAPK